MLNQYLEEQASLYVAGVMTAQERDQFELLAETHEELGKLIAELSEAGCALELALRPAGLDAPSAGLKARIAGLIVDRPRSCAGEGLVRSGPDGRVEWINASFSAMCGYTLEELRGKKLGPILQGIDTDRVTAERMRSAVHEFRPCQETILNYHKSGSSYWVEVSITPIFNDAGEPIWLIARERELANRDAA